MKTVSILDLCYMNFDFEIFDIFPENWVQRKEFSLYRQKERPLSALFFVGTDIEILFFPSDTSPVCAKKGDIVFIPSGCRYSVRVEGTTTEKIDTYTINFDLRDEQKNPLILSDHICILANWQDTLWDVRLKNLFDSFYRIEQRNNTKARNLAKIKGDFFLLLNAISDAATQNNEFYYPIRKGVEVFCDEWNQNEKIEKYAKMCGISVTYFYRCFRKWSGISPVEYRNRLRLSNAQSLLRCTDMQIKEIADTVGFEDPFYFCRVFSESFGLSPQAYRKQGRQESSLC